MGTAYQTPLAPYEGHAMHGYPSSLAQVSRSKMGMDTANPQMYRPCAQQQQQLSQQQLASNWPSKEGPLPAVPTLPSNSQHIIRPASPGSGSTLGVPQSSHPSIRSPETLVYHSLEIPRRISPSGGNLADFAAQVHIISLARRCQLLMRIR